MAKDLTTSQAAALLRCSQQSVIRAIDKGLLPGYRIPGSKFRRLRLDALHKFMVDNGIPTDELRARFDLARGSAEPESFPKMALVGNETSPGSEKTPVK